jgi:putative transcriptional regulator
MLRVVNSVPSTLADRRRAKGFTQEELAQAAGVATSTIQKLEGGRRLPRVDLAIRLSRILEVPVDDLFDHEGAA